MPASPNTVPPDRRTAIADAALRTLAHHGARGLTHRAVDRELALAPGSTSYYFRTRAALLMAAAERLVALDSADVAELATETQGAAELVERWLTPERRERSLARVELLLTAARDPEFQFMRKVRATFVKHVEHSEGKPGGTSTAKATVALVDGLILHGLVAGAVSRSEARRAFELLRQGAKLVPRAQRRRARTSAR